MNKGVEGMVLLQFIVELNGSPTNFKVIRDICTGCGEAAIKTVRSTKWKPAEHHGQQVRQQVMVPVKFKVAGTTQTYVASAATKKPKEKENKPEPIEKSTSEEIIMNPDQPAQPKGGYEAFYPQMGRSITPPRTYKEPELSTVIQVQVESNGKISEVKFLKEIDSSIEYQVVKQIQTYRWEPAVHQGMKVRTIATFPLRLKFE